MTVLRDRYIGVHCLLQAILSGVLAISVLAHHPSVVDDLLQGFMQVHDFPLYQHPLCPISFVQSCSFLLFILNTCWRFLHSIISVPAASQLPTRA